MKPPRPWSRRRARMILGLLWLVDAGLQAQPHFFTADWWRSDLAQSVMGQPAPISASILWATTHLAAHAALANAVAIAVQAGIGLALLAGRRERAAIAVSIPWALAVWWIGEGLGALPTGFALLAAGAPGPALYYPLIALLAWPRPSDPGREEPVRAGAAVAAWSLLWVGGAILEMPWRFPAARILRANIEEYGFAQPGWVGGPAHAAYAAVGRHPLLIPVLLVLAQAAVGLGVILPPLRPPAVAAGVVLAAGFWLLVQGMGAILAGSATDPGAAPLLVLAGLLLSPPVPGRLRGRIGELGRPRRQLAQRALEQA